MQAVWDSACRHRDVAAAVGDSCADPSSRAKHPRELARHGSRIGEMLEGMVGNDEVDGLVAKREGPPTVR